jgi:hypothetical protein
MDPLERAKLVKKFADGRLENPGWAAMYTNAVEALRDENRELGWAIDKVGDKSPKATEAAANAEVLEGLLGQAQNNYDVHRPLEVDAYMVDNLVKLDMNPSLFTKAPPGPVPVPAPPMN